MFEAEVDKMKIQTQQAIDDIKKSAKKLKDTSNDHQQTLTEMQSVKSEINLVKDTCNEVQKTLAAMESILASFEKTIKNLNRNVTCKFHEESNSRSSKKTKTQQPKAYGNTKQVVIITSANTRILKNSPEIRGSFFELFP